MLRLNLYTACTAAFCALAYFTGFKVALAVVTLRLTNSPSTVGVVMMASAVLPALLSSWVGRAVDRHGVRPVLNGALTLLVCGGLILWWLPHYTATLFVAAALIGLGFNGYAVGTQKIIGALPASAAQADMPANERRKRNFGTLATGSSLSTFVGPLLAGAGLDHLPASAVFGWLILMPLAAWFLALHWDLTPAPAQLVPVSPPAEARPSRSPLLAPELRPLAVCIAMVTLAADAMNFFSPVIGKLQGLTATQVGSVVSAFAVGSFLVRVASGWFIARLNEWRYLAATLVACAALLLLFSQAGSALSMMALGFLLGAWLGLAQPMTQSLMHQSVPEHRVGEALGARLALVGATQIICPLVFGLGAQYLGITPTLALASLVLLACGVYTFRSVRRSGADTPPAAL
jgi:MFS family permease